MYHLSFSPETFSNSSPILNLSWLAFYQLHWQNSSNQRSSPDSDPFYSSSRIYFHTCCCPYVTTCQLPTTLSNVFPPQMPWIPSSCPKWRAGIQRFLPLSLYHQFFLFTRSFLSAYKMISLCISKNKLSWCHLNTIKGPQSWSQFSAPLCNKTTIPILFSQTHYSTKTSHAKVINSLHFTKSNGWPITPHPLYLTWHTESFPLH